jgi:Ca2+-transporting ATPase
MILEANDAMTRDALRVLGVAFQLSPDLPEEMETHQVENNLVFSGLIGMIDPPRTEVMAALQKARHAGIRTVMITGDYPNTARAIAESIELLLPDHKVLTGGRSQDQRCLCPSQP